MNAKNELPRRESIVKGRGERRQLWVSLRTAILIGVVINVVTAALSRIWDLCAYLWHHLAIRWIN